MDEEKKDQSLSDETLRENLKAAADLRKVVARTYQKHHFQETLDLIAVYQNKFGTDLIIDLLKHKSERELGKAHTAADIEDLKKKLLAKTQKHLDNEKLDRALHYSSWYLSIFGNDQDIGLLRLKIIHRMEEKKEIGKDVDEKPTQEHLLRDMPKNQMIVPPEQKDIVVQEKNHANHVEPLKEEDMLVVEDHHLKSDESVNLQDQTTPEVKESGPILIESPPPEDQVESPPLELELKPLGFFEKEPEQQSPPLPENENATGNGPQKQQLQSFFVSDDQIPPPSELTPESKKEKFPKDKELPLYYPPPVEEQPRPQRQIQITGSLFDPKRTEEQQVKSKKKPFPIVYPLIAAVVLAAAVYFIFVKKGSSKTETAPSVEPRQPPARIEQKVSPQTPAITPTPAKQEKKNEVKNRITETPTVNDQSTEDIPDPTLIRSAEDDRLYQDAVKQDTLAAYQNYQKQFPWGNHRWQVEKKIKESIRQAKEDFERGLVRKAIQERKFKLRRDYQYLSKTDVDTLSRKRNVLANRFETIVNESDSVLVDFSTGLMWHFWATPLDFNKTQFWLIRLYAGYSEWRLPSCEEALSILDNGRTYIPKSIPAEFQIWTGDRDIESRNLMWVMNFPSGSFTIADQFQAIYLFTVRTIAK